MKIIVDDLSLLESIENILIYKYQNRYYKHIDLEYYSAPINDVLRYLNDHLLFINKQLLIELFEFKIKRIHHHKKIIEYTEGLEVCKENSKLTLSV